LEPAETSAETPAETSAETPAEIPVEGTESLKMPTGWEATLTAGKGECD